MACEVSEEKLWSWVDRAAPELDRHVAECPECRRRADDLRGVICGVAASKSMAGRRLPERIGACRVRRLIGEGGQAMVYEAEQQNPRRRVALKVLKNGSGAGRGSTRLFEREVESLARLEHAGIASIYEAGRTEEGWQYITMELVDGLPFNTFVRKRDLALPERLRLFRRVCEPVSYAHQRGVIHRDLKPSNILVDDAGKPHVLDFGLAQTTESDVTITLTTDDSGKILGTLPYMSPEQASGNARDIDVRGDVYSLGVLLYELLTGRLPHRVSSAVPHEALRAIREEPPPRPSSINSLLRGDLETIILKALEKDAARRYQSVAALADDIERFLNGEPILARRPSAPYQFRKLVARHKTLFALTTALLVVTTAFGIVSTIQAAHERTARAAAVREAERATAAADRAESIRAFLEELLMAADPRFSAGEMTVRDLLDEAERRVDTDWSDDAGIEADLRMVLGRVYQRFGIWAKARPHFREALRIREAVDGRAHPNVADACLSLASVLIGRREFTEGAQLLQRAVEIRRAELGDDHDDVLAAVADLGKCRQFQGDHAAAERLFAGILETRRSRGDKDDLDLARAIENLASVSTNQKKFDQAVALYQEALQIRSRLFGDDHKHVAHGLHSLAETYRSMGSLDEAEDHYRQALAMFRNAPDQTANVVLMHLQLGRLEQDRGDLESALPLYAEALKRSRAVFPAWHYITLWCHKEYGKCLARAGRFEAAQESLKTALEGLSKLSGDDDSLPHELRTALADLYRDWGKPELEAGYRDSAGEE